MNVSKEFEPGKYFISSNNHEISLNLPKTTQVNLGRIADSDHYREGLGLPDFRPYSPDREWGYGGNLSLDDSDEKFLNIKCQLPKGGRNNIDWDKMYQASANLELLLGEANTTPISNSPIPSLAEVNLYTRKQMHGGFVGVVTHPALNRWVNKNLDRDNQDIIQTMKDVYKSLMGRSFKELDRDFRVDFDEPKWIYLHIPGDATSLGVEGTRRNDDEDIDRKVKMNPQNSDGPVQQLTLLAGFGKIMDEAATYYLHK